MLRRKLTASPRNGAMTSGGTRIGRPLALSMIAQWVRARTQHFAVLADEFHVPVEPRALGRLADPGPRDDPVALEGGAEIVDLVPHDDPEISVLVLRVGDAAPMRHRDLLDPLHPHRIVDVAELVDVLRRGDQLHFEGRPQQLRHSLGVEGEGDAGLPSAAPAIAADGSWRAVVEQRRESAGSRLRACRSARSSAASHSARFTSLVWPVGVDQPPRMNAKKSPPLAFSATSAKTAPQA